MVLKKDPLLSSAADLRTSQRYLMDFSTCLHDDCEPLVELGGVPTPAGAQDQEAIIDFCCNGSRLDILTACSRNTCVNARC